MKTLLTHAAHGDSRAMAACVGVGCTGAGTWEFGGHIFQFLFSRRWCRGDSSKEGLGVGY